MGGASLLEETAVHLSTTLLEEEQYTCLPLLDRWAVWQWYAGWSGRYVERDVMTGQVLTRWGEWGVIHNVGH